MTKVLVLGSFAESLIVFRGHLLQAMLAKGHEVFACAPDASVQVQQQLRQIGVLYRHAPVDRTGLNPINDLYMIWRLILLFRHIRPTTVLSYTIKPVLYGSLAAKLTGVPRSYSIITGLGYAFMQDDKKRRWLNWLVRTLYRLILKTNRVVFFQNLDDCDTFRQMGLLSHDAQTIVLHGSGVDLDYYASAPFPEKMSFLLIARFLKDKGLCEYVDAARLIKQRYPDIAFRLVGWLDENPASISQQELDAWIHEGVIEYLGKLSDVRPAIAASSVYVLPSYREGTPRTVLEAMAMGRPIITTDAPGCRETVKDGENGFLIPVKDVSALVAAMERFIQSPELIKSMGKVSRKIAVEKYDVHKVNAVILDAMGLN